MRILRVEALVALLASTALGSSAWAQTASTALGEIVVTAQRVQESAQHAGIAVSAVGAKELSSRGVASITQLTNLVPALRVDAGSGPYMAISLRGVSSYAANAFADQAIATNLDGVYLPRPSSLSGMMFDLERVEVLKGPQGTLYGRNATGGAINIVTKNPVMGQYGGDIGVDLGNFNLVHVNGAVNIPWGETLAMRVAVDTIKRDGYFSDGSSDDDRQSGRISLKYVPNETLSVLLKADYTHIGGKGPGATALCVGGLPVGTSNPNTLGKAGCTPTGQYYADPWTSGVTLSPRFYPASYPIWNNNDAIPDAFTPAVPLQDVAFTDNSFWTVYGQLDWNVLGGTLTLEPAFRHEHLNFMSEAALAGFRELSTSRQVSFEARYASDASKALRYILGAYYLNEDHKGSAWYDGEGLLTPPTVGFFPPGPNLQYQNSDNSVWSGAVFANATYKVTNTVRLNAGIRYTYEEKETDSNDGAIPFFVTGRDVTPTILPGARVNAQGYYLSPPIGGQPIFFTTKGTKDWSSVTWKAGGEWDVRPNSLLYASVSTGFKSGGFFFSPVPGVDNFTYKPEKLTAYTVGSKNRFFGDRLLLNAEAFYWVYRDQQVAALTTIPPFIVFPQQNAKRAEIKGVEAEAAFKVTDNTLVSLDAQYLDAVYKDYVLTTAFPAAGCQTLALGPPLKVDCSGKRMPQSPRWTLTAGVQHSWRVGEGQVAVALDTRYESERLAGYNTWQVIKSSTQSDASLTYTAPGDRWSIQGYVRNIENAVTPINIAQAFSQVAGVYAVTLRPPRTYGVKLAAKF